MTFDFFAKFYDLSDYKINKIYIKDNKLYIDTIMNIHLELIANGYRPELEMDQEKTFVFSTDHNDFIFDTPYLIKEVSFEKRIIAFNDDIVNITDIEVQVL